MLMKSKIPLLYTTNAPIEFIYYYIRAYRNVLRYEATIYDINSNVCICTVYVVVHIKNRIHSIGTFGLDFIRSLVVVVIAAVAVVVVGAVWHKAWVKLKSFFFSVHCFIACDCCDCDCCGYGYGGCCCCCCYHCLCVWASWFVVHVFVRTWCSECCDLRVGYHMNMGISDYHLIGNCDTRVRERGRAVACSCGWRRCV